MIYAVTGSYSSTSIQLFKAILELLYAITGSYSSTYIQLWENCVYRLQYGKYMVLKPYKWNMRYAW